MTLTVQKAFLSFAAGIGEMMGEERCQRFLSSLKKVLDLMQAFLLSEGIFFLFAITLFLKTKGSMV